MSLISASLRDERSGALARPVRLTRLAASPPAVARSGRWGPRSGRLLHTVFDRRAGDNGAAASSCRSEPLRDLREAPCRAGSPSLWVADRAIDKGRSLALRGRPHWSDPCEHVSSALVPAPWRLPATGNPAPCHLVEQDVTPERLSQLGWAWVRAATPWCVLVLLFFVLFGLLGKAIVPPAVVTAVVGVLLWEWRRRVKS